MYYKMYYMMYHAQQENHVGQGLKIMLLYLTFGSGCAK